MTMARVEICCSYCLEPVPFDEEQPEGPIYHRACEPLWIKRLRAEIARLRTINVEQGRDVTRLRAENDKMLEQLGQACVRAEAAEDALEKMERQRDAP